MRLGKILKGRREVEKGRECGRKKLTQPWNLKKFAEVNKKERERDR